MRPDPTFTQLSAPHEASRRTGWPGALEATSEPLGAAGAQLTAVQPTGCAPSICGARHVWGRRQRVGATPRAEAGRGGKRAGARDGAESVKASGPDGLTWHTLPGQPTAAPCARREARHAAHLVGVPGAIRLVCQHREGAVRGGRRQHQSQLVGRPAQRVDAGRVQRRLVDLPRGPGRVGATLCLVPTQSARGRTAVRDSRPQLAVRRDRLRRRPATAR